MSSLGIDVSKASLSCAYLDQVREFPNTLAGFHQIQNWAPEAPLWCMEATGRFHDDLAQFAFELGKRCLVVNPGRAKQYLSFVDSRAKTDRVDALALARLADREGENLRPYKPVPLPIQEGRNILVRRRALVESHVALKQVAQMAGDPSGDMGKALDAITASIKELESQLSQTLSGYPRFRDLMTIPGIGKLSAAVLVCALERGEFLTSDSLVAFAGLDPRPRDSGKRRGVRTLSHQGDAQLRTILFMAARAGSRTLAWKPYYAAQKAKGLSSTEATIILARKLLRVAWSVYRQQGPFIQKNGPALDNLT